MSPLSERYLELIKSALTNEIYVELEAQLLMSVLCAAQNTVLDLDDFEAARRDDGVLTQLLEAKRGGDSVLLEVPAEGSGARVDGGLRNYSEFAYTLIGRRRLDNVQTCIESILADGVSGDLLEAGVWRGGCGIFMRAVLAAHDDSDRNVWMADSFAGLPPSTAAEDADYAMDASLLPVLAVTEKEVRNNFSRFGLLDRQVRFLPGWFDESLPDAPVDRLSLLRVDCDLFSSTTSVLESLYDRVSEGGWVIIDDYHMLPPCRQAVDEFRVARAIKEPLETVDDHAVCWQVGSC